MDIGEKRITREQALKLIECMFVGEHFEMAGTRGIRRAIETCGHGHALILDNLWRLDKSRAGIELLPYHVLGRSKYHHLEKEYPMEGHDLLPMETLERLTDAARIPQRPLPHLRP